MMGEVSEDSEDLNEETFVREGEDLLKICEQIYSHTPQAMEYALKYKETPKGYTSSLERILNILKLYLELLLEFISLSPKISSAFRRHKGVYASELSTPALAYMVWTRVKFLTTDSIRNVSNSICLNLIQYDNHKLSEQELSTIAEESDRNQTSEETQTLQLSLTACESCYLSQTVVKDLVAKVEFFCSTHDITESSVLHTREQLRSKVHDMTEWDAMSEWCKALTTDIEQLTEISDKLLTNWKKERLKEKKRYEELENKLKEVETNESITKDNRENIADEKYQALQNRNKILMAELDQKRDEIIELTSKVKYFEEEYQAELNKNKILQLELEENTKELKELKNKIEMYKASSISIQGDCKKLKDESKNEKQNIKQIEAQVEAKIIEASGIIAKYESEISEMNKRVADMENESRIQKNILNEQLKSLEMQEREINRFKKNEETLNDELKKYEEIVGSSNNLQEQCKILQKELESKTKEEAMLKDKMNLLEKQINNLSEHCDYLKHRLKKCDPTYKRGSGEPSQELETDTEGSLRSHGWNEGDLNNESN